jgi:hypothetical protein
MSPHLNPLNPRILPIPHQTYVAGAQISVKLAIAIIVLIFVVIAFSVCLCCICFRRSRNRRLTRRFAREAAVSKALPPKINRANAKFYGPGMGVGVEEVEMGSFVGQEGGVRRPERVWVRWREVLRGRIVEG